MRRTECSRACKPHIAPCGAEESSSRILSLLFPVVAVFPHTERGGARGPRLAASSGIVSVLGSCGGRGRPPWSTIAPGRDSGLAVQARGCPYGRSLGTRKSIPGEAAWDGEPFYFTGYRCQRLAPVWRLGLGQAQDITARTVVSLPRFFALGIAFAIEAIKSLWAQTRKTCALPHLFSQKGNYTWPSTIRYRRKQHPGSSIPSIPNSQRRNDSNDADKTTYVKAPYVKAPQGYWRKYRKD